MKGKVTRYFRNDKGSFHGLYNVRLSLVDGRKVTHKRVFVDNEQWRLGNVRVTDESGVATLYARSDYKRVEYDSKDCYR